MARLKPFLTGTLLFSSISPDYERNLKEELFDCFKHIGIPFDTLYKMSIRDRKFYIMKYNKLIEQQNEAANHTTSTEDISRFTDMSQGVVG